MRSGQEHNLGSAPESSADEEISLLDILCFLKGAWKTIAVTSVVGFSAAVIYLLITPKQYEATAQITMAQIGAANNNNINPLGINIEEPALLIARLSSPTSFTPQVAEACGYQNQPDAALTLSKAIKLVIPKGVANVVELKTFGPSPQIAKDCALTLFDLIKVTQAQIVAPYIEEAKIKLIDDEERLQKAKDLVAKADRSGQAMSASYLSTRDEIRYLLDEITALKNVVTSNKNRTTRLVAPIYASDTPIAPKKRITLAAGVLGGLFLGLLIALGCQMVARLKSEMAGVE
jgi:uncharacterized protein involved in exopolysaccharide biosynthesis